MTTATTDSIDLIDLTDLTQKTQKKIKEGGRPVQFGKTSTKESLSVLGNLQLHASIVIILGHVKMFLN